jgi:carbon monoxide dehydrogenase subunit G
VRREVRVRCDPDALWAWVGDASRLPEWFPGIESCTVDGTTRVITTGSGIPIPEEIVTVDPLQRRFQYRITGGMVREHLSTIDVVDLGDGTCLLSYSVDADPSTMALVIGGAGGNAIDHLRRIVERDERTASAEGAS